MSHNLAAVRALVADALGDDALQDLCHDHFRPVYDQFAAGQTKSSRVRMLVEYADRQRELEKLLAAVRDANPGAYAEFEPRLGTAGAPGGAKGGPSAERRVKVLFLAASPASMTPLALDQEAREIEAKIRASEHRDALELITKWAVRPDDLLQYLNQHQPHVVHFSGHGSDAGEIVLLNKQGRSKKVTKQALVSLFRTLKGNVRLVVLNACFTLPQAEAIAEHIDCAVGTNKAVGDRAAIVFAAAFYRAIGFGRSVREAFEQGQAALQLEGISGHRTPELVARKGVDPTQVILVAPDARSKE